MTCVYVANADTQEISVFRLRLDGSLTAVATVAVQAPPQPGRSMLLATTPERRLLYAAYLSGSDFAVSTYTLDGPDGVPRCFSTAALADTMAYMATDRTGRYLLCASYAGNRVTVNAIGADGSIGELLQSIATQPKAHCIITDAANRHVLHTSLGGDVIYQQHFDAATGRLAPNQPATLATPFKSGPRFVRLGHDERFAYVNGELDGSVAVYPYDSAAGTLQACIQTVSVLPAGFGGTPWAADLVLNQDGKYLYASERTSSTIAAFAIDPASGLLRPVSVVAAVERPRALCIDPSGRFLIAAGQLSNSVGCYAIDPRSGALQPLGEYPAGRNPTWIAIVGGGA